MPELILPLPRSGYKIQSSSTLAQPRAPSGHAEFARINVSPRRICTCLSESIPFEPDLLLPIQSPTYSPRFALPFESEKETGEGKKKKIFLHCKYGNEMCIEVLTFFFCKWRK